MDKLNYTIWCTYHDEKLIKEYNLDYIPSYIKLFYVNNFDITEENINYLHPYINELVTFYYVWKNQIKSDYVGFCAYRRFFKKIDIDNLQKNKVHYLGYLIHNITQLSENCINGFNNDDKNLLYTYLNSLNIFDKDTLYEYFYTKKTINIPYCFAYIIEWTLFNKFCEITFGFLEYILPNYKDINIFIKNTIPEYKRKYSWKFEIACGIILSLLVNNKKISNTNWNDINLNIKYKSILLKLNNVNLDLINLEKIKLFVCKNKRTEANVYILCNKYNKEKLLNYLNKFHIIIPNIINDISEISQNTNIIELTVNQYIKCKDPEDFDLNKYTIENIK